MAEEPKAAGTTGGVGGGIFNGIGQTLFGSAPGGIKNLLGESDDEKRRKELLRQQAKLSGGFADQSQYNTAMLGNEANSARQNLQKMASGELSYSREALRQGLQQQQAAQRSMAAGASPMAGPMAARNAAMNMGRAGYGMSGQAALAGIQEQQGASKMLQDAILQQRQQDMQAALGARQTAVTGYGGNQQPEKSNVEKYGPMFVGALGAMSDKRLKKNVRDADGDAKAKLAALKAYSYDYKNKEHGKGRQFGIMAQDLEKAGLGHAVIDTPAGKMVHGAKLATANTGMLAALAKRVSRLEEP